MKKLFLELSFAALCAALLSACGESSGNAANTPTYTETEEGIAAETKEDLPNCSKNREGLKATLDEGNFVCTGGRWTAEDPVYESEEDLPRCSSKREGEKAKTENGNFVCVDGEWAKEISGYDTEEDLPRCTKRKEGTVVFVEETEVTMVCEDGEWINASEGSEGSSASVPGGSSDASVYDADKNTLTDLRDGQTYKTITIAPEGTDYSEVWMAENLNYAYTGVPFDNDYYTSDSTSWCYGDDPFNCAKYGRLYTWAAAMDSVGEWSTSGKGCGYGKTCSVASAGSATLVRGVCPKGWHLPSHDEWESLIVAVDGSITEYTYPNTAGTKLKSVTGWAWDDYDDISGNGTDTFGFSALPAGFRDSGGNYNGEGYSANFWSSTEDSSYYAYSMYLFYGYDDALLSNNYKDYGFSVRCLKD